MNRPEWITRTKRVVPTWGALFLLLWSLAATLAAEPLPDGLTLATWGMPGESRFVVDVRASGDIVVRKEALPITRKGITRSTHTVRLTKDAAVRLLELALAADDLDEGCGTVADGTSAALEVWFDGRQRRSRCTGAVEWPVGSRTKLLVEAINKLLPPEFHVY